MLQPTTPIRLCFVLFVFVALGVPGFAEDPVRVDLQFQTPFQSGSQIGPDGSSSDPTSPGADATAVDQNLSPTVSPGYSTDTPVNVLIDLQSVGGDGGNGSPNGGGPGTTTSSTTFGRDGGAGGDVTLTLGYDIPLTDSLGNNILTQLLSQGGQGGGGDQATTSGSGGNAGKITLDFSGKLDLQVTGAAFDFTQPDQLFVLESRGGDAGEVSLEGNPFNMYDSFDLGAFLGAGGNAGEVSATIASGATVAIRNLPRAYQSSNDAVTAIQLQSLGGTGSNLSTGIYQDLSSDTLTAGSGGDAAKVALTNQGAITTSEATIGVSLLSQGGDGGENAANIKKEQLSGGTGGAGSLVAFNQGSSGSITTTTNFSPALILSSVGGDGGAGTNTDGDSATGGNGGNAFLEGEELSPSVWLNNEGSISTSGLQSSAVILESIGGAGGNSGSSADGGKGGNGGMISATNSGAITTMGDDSYGILAQSVGGTGGNGGDGGLIGDGGSGGDGGTGGNVSITNRGMISTMGEASIALAAQSVGGGNSDGALLVSQTVNDLVDPNTSAAGKGGAGGSFFFGDGGEGGTGGSSGQVSITNSESIRTGGATSSALFAQSIGGGGGIGGSDGSSGLIISIGEGGAGAKGGQAGMVTVNNTGLGTSIITQEISSHGIVAHSIGGTGGSGGSVTSDAYGVGGTFSLAVGGTGGNGSKSEQATVNNSAGILTRGLDSHGIFALSVGGGGGQGGMATAESTTVGLAAIPELSVTFSLNFSKGGGGGTGAQSESVSVTNHGYIGTEADGSYGIFATSIGGGGGIGGNSIANAISAGTAANVSVNLAVGGGGGESGTAETVTVTNTGFITTYGNNADGIYAASIGGAGGLGGSGGAETNSYTVGGIPVSFGDSISISEGVGGAGGDGNTGNLVTLKNSGEIMTFGKDSRGVFAQSIGGGGGKSGNGSATAASTLTLDVSAGAQGGTGSHGGDIMLTNEKTGTIITLGDGSHGLQAQSVGGGGGSAGTSSADQSGTPVSSFINWTLDQASDDRAQESLDAEFNGNGDFQLFTAEQKAQKIKEATEAKEIADTAAKQEQVLETADQSFDRLIVNKSTSNLKTGLKVVSTFSSKGAQAAVDAGASSIASRFEAFDTESLPSFNLDMALGGSAGAAGHGGDLNVTNLGEIITVGDDAMGVFLQTVGGGGGTAGAASASTSKAESVTIALGATGPDSGDAPPASNGGNITLSNQADITTFGDSSFGVLAQSVGGGGGKTTHGLPANFIGTTEPATSTQDPLAPPEFPMLTLGASGGIKDDQDDVIGNSSTNLPVKGDGGTIMLTNTGTVTTTGTEAHGIVGQSVGAGGGISIFNAANREGSAIGSTQEAQMLQTNFEQKVVEAAGQEKVEAYQQAFQDATEASSQHVLQIGLAADIAEGDGGAVTIEHGGTITTKGDTSFGIFAQSIGAGGGFISDGIGMWGEQTDQQLITIGDFIGRDNQGNGGDVTVSLQDGSSINTLGQGSAGIVAQSIGGGGGYTGALNGVNELEPVPSGFGPEYGPNGQNLGAWFNADGIDFTTNTGSGGNVSIQMASATGTGAMSITTTGDKAHGIVAQTLIGGGGLVADGDGLVLQPTSSANYAYAEQLNATPRLIAQGKDESGNLLVGNIDINTRGTISVSGQDSVGIFAQAGALDTVGQIDTSRSYGNQVNITHAGNITGGSGQHAAGLEVRNNGDVTVDFSGGTLSAANGVALRLFTTGETKFTNHGMVVGTFDNQRNSMIDLDNYGTLYLSTTSLSMIGNQPTVVNGTPLGDTGSLTNYGTFNVGGPGNISPIEIGGNFANSGTWQVDLDQSNASDRVVMLNQTADLGGKVAPIFNLTPGQKGLDTIYANILAGAANDNGITVEQSIAATYQLNIEPTQTQLIAAVNLAPSSFTRNATANEKEAAAYLQQLYISGNYDADLAAHLESILGISNFADYEQAVQDLSTEAHAFSAGTAPTKAQTFHNNIHSVPVFTGDNAELTEGTGIWTRGIYTNIDHDNEAHINGFTQEDWTWQIGGQEEIMKRTWLGGSFAYDDRSVRTNNGRTSGEGESYSFGAVLKHQPTKPLLLSASFGYTYGEMNYDRQVTAAGVPATAESTQVSHTFSGRVRGAYNFDMGKWYIRPASNLDVVGVHVPSYTESGGGPLNMNFAAADSTQVGLTPELEIGGRIDLEDMDSILRPYLRLSATWWSDPDWVQNTRLASAAGAPAFQTVYEGDEWVGRSEFGLELVNEGGFECRAVYELQVGANFIANTGSLRFGWRF